MTVCFPQLHACPELNIHFAEHKCMHAKLWSGWSTSCLGCIVGIGCPLQTDGLQFGLELLPDQVAAAQLLLQPADVLSSKPQLSQQVASLCLCATSGSWRILIIGLRICYCKDPSCCKSREPFFSWEDRAATANAMLN